MKVSYLGPRGTFTEEALMAAASREGLEVAPEAANTVADAFAAVASGAVDRAFVPYENSIEGSVRPALDALIDADEQTAVVGEYDFPITQCLVAAGPVPLDQLEVVLSHPQGIAQCAHFLRDRVGSADVRSVSSTAEAVRLVCEKPAPGSEDRTRWAGIGNSAAAQLYGGTILERGIEDEAGNTTRFVWVAHGEVEPSGGGTEWRTSLVFSELGADHPGALVDALHAFSDRGVNLSRIESRPMRSGLGRYMFFLDLDGALADPAVTEAVAALRTQAESVRILGSYPVSPD